MLANMKKKEKRKKKAQWKKKGQNKSFENNNSKIWIPNQAEQWHEYKIPNQSALLEKIYKYG